MPTYKDYILKDSPTAAWMLDANVGTSDEVDITSGGRNATVSISDRASGPLVSGTPSSRSPKTFTINSGDTIYYPNMNIWSKGNFATPFSIEFIVNPISVPSTIKIFGPRDSGGGVIDNGIYLTKNKLSFVISNSTSGAIGAERYEAYTFLDFPKTTYHCAVVYQRGSIGIYVNGVIESFVSVPTNFDWAFVSGSPNAFETVGASTSSLMLAALAIYKKPLDEIITKSHYRAMSVRESSEQIATGSDGKTFMINDSDRKKSFYFNEPLINNWDGTLLDNIIINEKNRATLKVIEPPILNTGSESYVSGHLSLSSSQYLLIQNAGEIFNGSTGAVGVNVKYTAARHGTLASGEYCILSIVSSDKNSVIEVLEKSDKKIYLRYISRGTATDTLLASPSTGTDSDNYLYIDFTSSYVYAYWSVTGTSAAIIVGSSDSIYSPFFDNNTTLILGASSEATNNWGSQFWWLNILSSPLDISDIDSVKEIVYEYTLKMASSLKVSQAGMIAWALDTGSDGQAIAENIVNQSRIWWAPALSAENIYIETSLSGGWDQMIPIQLPGTVNSYVAQYIAGYTEDEITVQSGGSIYSEEQNFGEIFGVAAGDYMPNTIYARIILRTDDSVDNVPFIKKFGMDIFRDAGVIQERGMDSLSFRSDPKIYFQSGGAGLQGEFSGALIEGPTNGFYVYSSQSLDPITDTIATPEFAEVSAPAARVSFARTVEFWFKPKSTSVDGLIFKAKGDMTHSMSLGTASGSRVFTATGFDKMYIDGSDTPLTTSPILAAQALDKWRLVQLVINDVINQSDGTIFTAISGSPTVTLDTSKSYTDSRSVKIVAGASQGYVEVYGSITGLNTANAAYNTLSFFVYPAAGVTSISTNFRRNGTTDAISSHSVTPEKWNLVKRSYSNGAALTSLSVRIGTGASNQTIWIDGVGLVKGNDAFIQFDDGTTKNFAVGFDQDSLDTQQATFSIQNLSFYPRSLSQAQCVENFTRYSGPVLTSLHSSSANLVPASDTSVIFPSEILNRSSASIEKIFSTNPVYLSDSWTVSKSI